MTKRRKLLIGGWFATAIAAAVFAFVAFGPLFVGGPLEENGWAWMLAIVAIIGPLLYGMISLNRASREERRPNGVRLVDLGEGTWEVHIRHWRKWEPARFYKGGGWSYGACERDARNFYESTARMVRGESAPTPIVRELTLKTE